MSGPTKYLGSCHCGKVRYEVTMDLGETIACNCSMCGRKGHLLAFVTADQFKLLQGEEWLQDYQFNKKIVHHLFCKNCGVSSFTWGTGRDGRKMYSINARCLEGVDPHTLKVKQVDNRDR